MLRLEVARAAGSNGLRHDVYEVSKTSNSFGFETGNAALNSAKFLFLVSSYRCYLSIEILLHCHLNTYLLKPTSRWKYPRASMLALGLNEERVYLGRATG